jgi:2'-5' RNA ligase
VRERFDPHAGLLAAHVTLVFPFADPAVERILERHVAEAIAGIESFDIAVASPRADDRRYIFLELSEGVEHFVEMHDRLYSGILAGHRSTSHRYQPHVTVGHLSKSEDLAGTVECARDALPRPLRGRVDTISGFRLDHPWRGEVVFNLPLGTKPR